MLQAQSVLGFAPYGKINQYFIVGTSKKTHEIRLLKEQELRGLQAAVEIH